MQVITCNGGLNECYVQMANFISYLLPNLFMIGAEAKKVFDDAQLLLQRIVDEKLLKAYGIVTLLPAQSVVDDILVYDEGGTDVIGVLHGLREQVNIIYPHYLLTFFISSTYTMLYYRQKRMWITHTCVSQTLLPQKRVECLTILVCLLSPVVWDAESYAASKILQKVFFFLAISNK